MSDQLKPDEALDKIDYGPGSGNWMDTTKSVQIRPGMYCYAAKAESVATLGLPNARPWNPLEDDWKLPEDWQQILHEGIKERLEKFRTFKIFMDVCVRCGACADKCHFFLGTGDPKYHQVLGQLATDHPEKIAVRLEFSNELAHRIEAGADMFLMPSQYEPCGLNQLYSLKYGTVPVVRATGGLADTVVDTTPQTLEAGNANGFSFAEYTALALSETLSRACGYYADKPAWQQLIRTGVQQDWSWKTSAEKYGELYQKIVEHARRGVLQ